MSVSEHANYLLNEYGRLQFDYAFFCKPDGESLRNEARNNLEEYIAELEKDNDEFRQLIRDWSIVLEQDNGFQLWHVESVRQAMLETDKERGAESERFTVHSNIERQDDKSPNDTQSSTIVYGKGSEE